MYESLGGLIISEEVIASIAINAAKNIEGVAGFAPHPGDLKGIFKKSGAPDKFVKVISNENEMIIHVYINLRGGSKIPVVAEAVQQKIKDDIQNMTSRVVSKVHVTIAGIVFEEAQQE